MNPAQHTAVFLLRVYQRVVSPVLRGLSGPAGECRFTPSCSQYAREAVEIHGVVKGGALAARRLCRCHPWGGCGEDPVPPRVEPLVLKTPQGAGAGRG
jgi:putative membrane protein insertion efficiency factor